MRKTRILSLAMCLVMLLSCVPSFALASDTPLLSDTFSVDGVTSREGQSIKDWNGWSFASGNVTTAETEGKMTFTIEKDIDDADKTFETANKVIKMHRKGKGDNNLRAVKTFSEAYTGKVRVSFILDGRKATTLSNPVDTANYTTNVQLPLEITLANSDVSDQATKGILGKLSIDGKGINSYYQDGDTSKNSYSGDHVYSKLKVVFEVDTINKQYSTYIYKNDGTSMASFENQALLTPSGTTNVEIKTLRFTVDRGRDVNAYWAIDDIKVETYNDDVDENYLANDANWELSEKDDFQSIESTTYETYKNNTNGWNNYFKDGWNNWSLVSGNVSTAITENHTQFNIIKDPNAEEGKWDQANKYMQMKHFAYTTSPAQNLSFRKKLSKAYSGRYKIKFNLNSKDDNYGSGYIPFKVFFNDKDAINNYMDDKYIFTFGITNEYAYVDNNGGSKYIGRKTGWFPVEFDIDTANSRFDLYINGDKTTGFSESKDTIFYPKNSNGETSVEYLTFNMGDRTINGAASWYVDDIEVWTPKYWQVKETDDVTENLYTNEKTIEQYSNGWSATGDARVSLADGTNTALKLINAATVSKGFTEGKEGVITATAKLLTFDNSGKLSMLLTDANENALTKVYVNKYNFGYSSDVFNAKPDDYSQNFVIDEALYTPGQWFTLKVVANTDKRTYDVYVNPSETANADKKIAANLPFYNTVDGGVAEKLAFECANGATWYIDDVSVEQTAAPETGIYGMTYKKSDDTVVLAPANSGKVSSVKVRVPNGGNARVFVAVYDKDGNIIDMGINSDEITCNGTLQNVAVDVDFPETGADLCDARAFLWDGVSLKPYCDTVSLNERDNVTIYVAGDSIAASYAANSYPMAGWGDMLRHYFDTDTVTIDNRAVGGRSTKSFITDPYYSGDDHSPRLEQIGKTIKKGDYLLVSFAHNDSGFKNKDELYAEYKAVGKAEDEAKSLAEAEATVGVTLDEYKAYVQRYIDFAKEHQATIIWVGAPVRATYDENGTLLIGGNTNQGKENEDLKTYTYAAKDVCEANGVPYIDLFKYTTDNITYANHKDWYCFVTTNDADYADDPIYAVSRYGTAEGSLDEKDTTHMQVYGAQMLAKKIATDIKALNNSLSDSIKLTFTPVAK